MRFMGPLSDEDISVLQDHYLHSEKPATRRRAHAILLSNKQFSMDQITVTLEVTRETVGHWFNSWEAQGIDGLHDKARSGRVPFYNESDIDQLETLLKESPHQLKTAQARLEKNTGKQSCGETLKRALKKSYSFKRARHSLRSLRNEEDFRNTQKIIEEFSRWGKEERCALYFFDESGFSQKFALPYAWSPSGQSVEIPARSHSQRLNVLGFLNRGGSLFYQATTDSVTTDVVIEAFEQFIARKDPETFIIIFLDNASMHRSLAFKQRCYEWMNHRVHIVYLSSYSPELNVIEQLWRKVKYEWLPLSAWLSFSNLCESVYEILDGYGEKYRINFV